MEQLRRNCGRQFDPHCVEVFEAYLTEDAGVHAATERAGSNARNA